MMKKSFFLLSILFCSLASAQTDIWMWQNGKFTKMEQVDSLTIEDPEKEVHESVDLGLSSGLLWATYNIGASKVEEYGDYFAWGETDPKDSFSWASYKWCEGNENSFTKYCELEGYGTVDKLKKLEAADDAATANWGSGWRMPTISEMVELYEGCGWEFTSDYNGSGVAGYIGTSKANSNTIFLPAAGYYDTSLDYDTFNSDCLYWTSSLCDNRSYRAYVYRIDEYNTGTFEDLRFYGNTVRAVVNK